MSSSGVDRPSSRPLMYTRESFGEYVCTTWYHSPVASLLSASTSAK